MSYVSTVFRGSSGLDEVTSGSELQIRNRYVHKRGQIVPMRWSAQWDEEDQMAYAIGRSGKITDREEAMRISLEDSSRRYTYVSQATSDAIWDWDIVPARQSLLPRIPRWASWQQLFDYL